MRRPGRAPPRRSHRRQRQARRARLAGQVGAQVRPRRARRLRSAAAARPRRPVLAHQPDRQRLTIPLSVPIVDRSHHSAAGPGRAPRRHKPRVTRPPRPARARPAPRRSARPAAAPPRPCPCAASPRRPSAVISVTAFSVPPMIPVAGRDVVGDDPVAALARAAWRVALRDHVVGLGGEAHHQPRPPLGHPRDRGQDVGVLGEVPARGGRPPSFLILRAEAVATRQSATAAAKTAASAGSAACTAASISARRLDPHAPSRPAGGGTRAGPGDEGHLARPAPPAPAAIAVPCAPEERLAM